MKNLLRPALTLFAVLTLIVGVLYPLAVTAIGRVAFADQAAGSLVMRSGVPVGSRLIGQSFSAPGYFWGRPSATAPMPNNAASSGGANLGPLNPALIDAVKGRIAALKAADPANHALIPVDLVTSSASGLDPDLSVAGARYQAARVAMARRLPVEQVQALITAQARGRTGGVLGEPLVNILALNLALDAVTGTSH